MRHLFSMLRNRFQPSQQSPTFSVAHPEMLQVVVPNAVSLPLPRTSRDEISVPASINGRDLSTGRL